METHSSEGNFNDDELFFGKLTLKEVKKRILFHNNRQSISCTAEINKSNNSNDSIKVIETHSEPIHSVRESLNSDCSQMPKDWDLSSADDSFLRLEAKMSELHNNEQLDNTLEVVEYILNNVPLNKNNNYVVQPCVKVEVTDSAADVKPSNVKSDDLDILNDNLTNKNEKTITHKQIDNLHNSPLKNPKVETLDVSEEVNAILTPNVKEQKGDVFKTPKNLIPLKNCKSASKKTPGKINSYQHITSPVASYIKSCPQVPLLRDVHPKKPLPGGSSIPKLVKSTCNNSGKENFALPSVAYKSAKRTHVITIPENNKLPQSPWAKKLASSLSKPMVLKHDHREINFMKKSIGHENDDSFANLPLHQADLSVITQKSAVSKPL